MRWRTCHCGGGHLDQAIELLSECRHEAVTIARNEYNQLTEDEQERFKLLAARRTALAMTVAADTLARTGALFDAPDVYDMPPYVAPPSPPAGCSKTRSS